LAIVAIGSANRKARDIKRLADLSRIQTQLDWFYTEQNTYPTGRNVLLGSESARCLNAQGWGPSGCANPLMAQVPLPPDESVPYIYNGSTSTYTITTSLEGEMDGLRGNIQVMPSAISQQ
jgi:hypothetical protein